MNFLFVHIYFKIKVYFPTLISNNYIVNEKQKSTPKKRWKFTDEFIKEITQKLLDWVKTSDTLWLGSFAQINGFHRHRLAELALTNEEFGKAFEIAKQAQENWLVTSALNKKVDCTMAIFALKNVAGWRDKTEFTGEVKFDIQSLITDIFRTEKENSRGMAKVSNN